MEKILKRLNELLAYDEARPIKEYLDTRISPEIQQLVPFGFFPKAEQIDSLLSDIPINLLIEEKLLYIQHLENTVSTKDIKISFFENHPLIIPYYDVYGELIALVGRTMLSSDKQKELKISKYKNTIFKKGNHLFGLNWAKEEIIKQNKVYLVEGQIDIFSAFAKGIKNVVAVGSSSLAEQQLMLLLRYTNNIHVMFDNDEAGEKGFKLIIDKYQKLASFKKVEFPSQYKDLDEYLHDSNSIN